MKYTTHGNLKNILIYPEGNISDTLKKIEDENKKGLLHILYTKLLSSYGLSTNMVIPYYDEYNSEIRELVVINNPEDAERITEKHIKKTPYLKPLLYDSIISTTDNNSWKEQRKTYQPAFSVKNELKKIIPISELRARISLDILEDISREYACKNINIYEFFLNETMAQLQLAMFGFSNDFQEETNLKIRNAFNQKDTKYTREFVFSFLKQIDKSKGSLSSVMRNRNNKCYNKKEIFGNALIFPYAGHDTTANTLTWLIYEICKNNSIYKKLQEEVDSFWVDKKDIEYDDFKKLTYMTRCIMEILRLWTSIPNGTFRELTEDDYILGRYGKQVKIPKGTYVQIPNWTRHRNPELWGYDVNTFNPDREFDEEEIFYNSGIDSYNPNTPRFSPFTYGPRDCIGKNFSQIEMRIILLHLLKNFKFSLPVEQINKYNQDNISFNGATLAPRSIYNKSLYENKLAMYVNIVSRNTISKL